MASYTFDRRRCEPHDPGEIRRQFRELHDHGRAPPAGQAGSSRARPSQCRRPPTSRSTSRRMTATRSSAVTVDGTVVDASKWNDDDCIHVRERHRQPHHHGDVCEAARPGPDVHHHADGRRRMARSLLPAPQTFNAGDNATYTITPDAGYHVADVLVNGQSVGAAATYTFTGVSCRPDDLRVLRLDQAGDEHHAQGERQDHQAQQVHDPHRYAHGRHLLHRYDPL